MGLLEIFGLVTGGAAAIAVIWKIVKWFRNVTEGIRCQLRTEMLRIYYHNKDDETIRQYEMENFIKNYNAYKALGGNSFIDDIYKIVITWKVIT